jgi:hypothetical protein
VRLVRLDTGESFTVAADMLVRCDGEYMEAGALSDPERMVRIPDGAKAGFLAVLQTEKPLRDALGRTDGTRPAVHWFDVRGALSMPRTPERERTVPGIGETPATAPAPRKGARTRGTVNLQHGPGWTAIRWPADADRKLRALVIASLPTEANVDKDGGFVRYVASARSLVRAELLAALTDCGFAVTQADKA